MCSMGKRLRFYDKEGKTFKAQYEISPEPTVYKLNQTESSSEAVSMSMAGNVEA